MADTWKSAALDWLADLGYPYATLDNPMEDKIQQWWNYYRSEGEFWKYKEIGSDGKPVDVVIRSMTPGNMACEDLAGMVYNERASISFAEDSDLGTANAWLDGWLRQTKFQDRAPWLVQRTAAVGTGAWALHLRNVAVVGKSVGLKISAQRYDARHIVPLEWDSDECVACAFVSTVFIRGEELTQVEVHRPKGNGSYELMVRFFDDEGKTRLPDGYSDGSIDTRQPEPTFALTTIGLDNHHWDGSPFGVSLLDRAIDAIETVDLAFNNISNDIFLGKKMVMFPAAFLKKDEASGSFIAPPVVNKQFFVALEDKTVYENGMPKIVEYNPTLRAEENGLMLSKSLQILGKRLGFGTKYYSLDDAGGLTTAKEVASDNSEMMRTVARCEHVVKPAIETVITAAANIYRELGGIGMPSDVGDGLNVVMGDSIMQDDDSLRERDRADLAIGALELWQYMVRWQGYTEEDAKAAAGTSATDAPLEA